MVWFFLQGLGLWLSKECPTEDTCCQHHSQQAGRAQTRLETTHAPTQINTDQRQPPMTAAGYPVYSGKETGSLSWADFTVFSNFSRLTAAFAGVLSYTRLGMCGVTLHRCETAQLPKITLGLYNLFAAETEPHVLTCDPATTSQVPVSLMKCYRRVD